MRRIMLLVVLVVLSSLSLSPAAAKGDGKPGLYLYSEGNSGIVDCAGPGPNLYGDLTINQLIAHNGNQVVGPHGFVNLDADGCDPQETYLGGIFGGPLSPGDITGNRNEVRLRTTLTDESGSGRTVTLDLAFNCLADESGHNVQVPCPAIVTGSVTVSGLTFPLSSTPKAYINMNPYDHPTG